MLLLDVFARELPLLEQDLLEVLVVLLRLRLVVLHELVLLRLELLLHHAQPPLHALQLRAQLLDQLAQRRVPWRRPSSTCSCSCCHYPSTLPLLRLLQENGLPVLLIGCREAAGLEGLLDLLGWGRLLCAHQ